IWLGFRGGKGIATSAGTIIALYPWQVFAAALIAWALLFWTTRYVSVASIGAAFIFPIASSILFYLDQCGGILTTLAFLLSILAIWKHRSNIIRLRNGTEPKFSKKPKISSLPS
ncbi:MAG: glycerol-3-phosphate acyltransferase, partial [Chthoniobacterales bacterium]|nr:glycerol-3-phosphate acyltransferase [Chthoniobacterales bacterium]